MQLTCNANVSLLERWCIIHTIACHAHKTARGLQGFHDGVLMLRVDASKPIHSVHLRQIPPAIVAFPYACCHALHSVKKLG